VNAFGGFRALHYSGHEKPHICFSALRNSVTIMAAEPGQAGDGKLQAVMWFIGKNVSHFAANP
jgi:hypothetical protein